MGRPQPSTPAPAHHPMTTRSAQAKLPRQLLRRTSSQTGRRGSTSNEYCRYCSGPCTRTPAPGGRPRSSSKTHCGVITNLAETSRLATTSTTQWATRSRCSPKPTPCKRRGCSLGCAPSPMSRPPFSSPEVLPATRRRSQTRPRTGSRRHRALGSSAIPMLPPGSLVSSSPRSHRTARSPDSTGLWARSSTSRRATNSRTTACAPAASPS